MGSVTPLAARPSVNTRSTSATASHAGGSATSASPTNQRQAATPPTSKNHSSDIRGLTKTSAAQCSSRSRARSSGGTSLPHRPSSAATSCMQTDVLAGHDARTAAARSRAPADVECTCTAPRNAGDGGGVGVGGGAAAADGGAAGVGAGVAGGVGVAGAAVGAEIVQRESSVRFSKKHCSDTSSVPSALATSTTRPPPVLCVDTTA
eukprot:TRINITY_DN732_c0_g1_i1.p1 TRINITY_DN732_c0_g1~~TRINITY_DN732_c0_g1_i1.p1  ORF type:complete len:206 (-),score=49.67 TRINITY_DN732_c0_g1_i1:7-624(-)